MFLQFLCQWYWYQLTIAYSSLFLYIVVILAICTPNANTRNRYCCNKCFTLSNIKSLNSIKIRWIDKWEWSLNRLISRQKEKENKKKVKLLWKNPQSVGDSNWVLCILMIGWGDSIPVRAVRNFSRHGQNKLFGIKDLFYSILLTNQYQINIIVLWDLNLPPLVD